MIETATTATPLQSAIVNLKSSILQFSYLNMYLDIIPATNLPLNRSQIYTYGLPNNLAGRVSVGQIVEAPLYFRKVTGVVLGKRKGLGKNSKNFKIKNIFNIADLPPFTKEQLKLARWLSDYYYVSLGLVIKSMLPPLTKKKPGEPPAYTDILKKYNLTLPHSLENSETAEEIIKSSQKQFFLFSKNRKDVYGNLTVHYVKQKKQVLILVPEISDVLFMAHFIEQAVPHVKIAVLTSDLTKNQYAGHWLNIHNGSANVIIGTRMAVFAPLKNLGLIIMDDEHDSSFKQWEMNPRYHAREAAWKLAELHRARLVLGTATPSVESYYFFSRKHPSTRLPSGQRPFRVEDGVFNNTTVQQYDNNSPQIKLVDIRDEYKRGNFSLLSEELQNKLAEILDSRGQAILFINRKGTAGFIQCQDCGTVEKCPECDLPLVYHEQKEELACHHCGFTKENPLTCAHCDSPKIKYQSPGLDKLAKETQKLFPEAKIAAVDAKNVKTKKELVQLAQNVFDKKIDILIGTQALTKLPDRLKFDLAGIVRADNILNIPEFNQSEKSWQLLSQLTKYGKTVILQTHRPDNEAIKAIVNNEAEKFLEEELKNREKWGYPPFGQLVKLIYRKAIKQESKKANDDTAYSGTGEKEARKLVEQLKNAAEKNQYKDIEINGPLKPLVHKVREKYIWHIIIKFKKPDQNAKKNLLSPVGKDWIIDVDPDGLL